MLSLAAVAAMTLASGCALNKPYPEKASFLPNIQAPRIADTKVKPLNIRLKVRNTRVKAPFEGKSFVYRLTDDHWETDFYKEWLTYPRDILTESTVDYLVQSEGLAMTSTEDSLVEADYYLEGVLNGFYLDKRNPSTPTSEVSIQWVLIPNRPMSEANHDSTFWSKEYTQRIQCKDNTSQAYVQSTATALGKIFESLNTDLIRVLETSN